MLGTYISGPLYGKLGYYAVFISSFVFAIIGAFYMMFKVKESKPKPKLKGKNKNLFNIKSKIIILSLLKIDKKGAWAGPLHFNIRLK